MKHVISDKLYTPEEYLKLILGEEYVLPETKNQVETVEIILDEKNRRRGVLWSHALTEIEHISNDNGNVGVVLVDCLIYNEETQENEHCYRWFEVEELVEDNDDEPTIICVATKLQ